MADHTDDTTDPGAGHGLGDGRDASRPFWRRRSTLIGCIVVAALVVLAVVIALSLTRAGDSKSASPASSTSASGAESTSTRSTASTPQAPSTPSPASTATAKATAAPSATAVPTPGATSGSVPATIGQVAEPKKGVVVTIAHLGAVTGKADGIGEISGPAIEFEAEVTNDTGATLPLDTATVTVTSGSAEPPANELVSSRKGFPASVAAGKTAVATYVFTLAENQRNDVTITFDYRAGTPVVAFSGSAPR